MTYEEVFNSINNYIFNHVPQDCSSSPADIYEDWRRATGIMVQDAELTVTILETINRLKNYDRTLLKELIEHP